MFFLSPFGYWSTGNNFYSILIPKYAQILNNIMSLVWIKAIYTFPQKLLIVLLLNRKFLMKLFKVVEMDLYWGNE